MLRYYFIDFRVLACAVPQSSRFIYFARNIQGASKKTFTLEIQLIIIIVCMNTCLTHGIINANESSNSMFVSISK